MAIATALLFEARQGPLCLVVEDLHWSDSGTKHVLELIANSLSSAALLVLFTYRQQTLSESFPLNKSHSLILPPLEHHDSEDLLTHILGVASEITAVKQTIAKQAEGNPLFIEECVRSLVDEGLLQGAPGEFYPTGVIEDIRLPQTVALAISARIDLLEPTQKNILQAAASIGPQVPAYLLADVTGIPPAEIDFALDVLCSGEFLTRVISDTEPQYDFRHSVLREVAYQSLLAAQRRKLHFEFYPQWKFGMRTVSGSLRSALQITRSQAMFQRKWLSMREPRDGRRQHVRYAAKQSSFWITRSMPQRAFKMAQRMWHCKSSSVSTCGTLFSSLAT